MLLCSKSPERQNAYILQCILACSDDCASVPASYASCVSILGASTDEGRDDVLSEYCVSMSIHMRERASTQDDARTAYVLTRAADALDPRLDAEARLQSLAHLESYFHLLKQAESVPLSAMWDEEPLAALVAKHPHRLPQRVGALREERSVITECMQDLVQDQVE